MKIIFDDGKEIEFDENEVTLQDHRERIFKKDGIWYITKIINKDFAEWLDEAKPMVIKEKKIPEKLGECAYVDGEIAYSWSKSEAVLKTKINELIDYLKSKGDE